MYTCSQISSLDDTTFDELWLDEQEDIEAGNFPYSILEAERLLTPAEKKQIFKDRFTVDPRAVVWQTKLDASGQVIAYNSGMQNDNVIQITSGINRRLVGSMAYMWTEDYNQALVTFLLQLNVRPKLTHMKLIFVDESKAYTAALASVKGLTQLFTLERGDGDIGKQHDNGVNERRVLIRLQRP